MATLFSAFFESLDLDTACKVHDWLDRNPNAVQEMIDDLLSHHGEYAASQSLALPVRITADQIARSNATLVDPGNPRLVKRKPFRLGTCERCSGTGKVCGMPCNACGAKPRTKAAKLA